MGYQLWISPDTGIRRKGTTFKELQELFTEHITVKFIYEELFSCNLKDDANEVKEVLTTRDFDVIGVGNEKKQVVGFCLRDELEVGDMEQHMHKIEPQNLISDSTPISHLFTLLSQNNFLFVLSHNSVSGIITKADLNKPLIRVYLFGIFSLFEMHMNYWIGKYCKGASWQDYLNPNRINLAQEIFENKKSNNMELTMLECLQISDKKVILCKTDLFCKTFDFSKRKFENLVSHAEKIRNELAHSQNSILSILKWDEFASTINYLEMFLLKSEYEVEKSIEEKNGLTKSPKD